MVRVRSWQFWLVVVLGVLAIGIAFTAQDAAWRAAEGLPVPWGRLARRHILYWAAWAVFIPVLAAMTERWPLDAGMRLRRLPGWLGVGLAIAVGHTTITILTSYAMGWLSPPPPPAQPNVGFAIWVSLLEGIAGLLLYFGLIAGAMHALRYERMARSRELDRARVESRLAEAELDVLRMRQQPHFFFNTLNTVSALLETDTAAARGVLARLGDLLRASLHTARQEQSLEEELGMLERYLDIQRARFRDRLDVRIAVPPPARRALVPTFLLQPLVENCVRHALEQHRGALHVEVSATMTDDRMTVTVADDGPGASELEPASAGHGVGLASLRARLLQLHGPDSTLRAGNRERKGYAVEVTMPLRIPT